MSDDVAILVAGDLCPIGINEDCFRKADATGLVGELIPVLAAADLVLANLECPLIKRQTPAVKVGPALGADAATIAGIRALGIHVLGLANNHIYDHGEEGLAETLKACAQAGIQTVGAGATPQEAGQILILERKRVKIGVMAVAEAECSVVSEHNSGANPLDLAKNARATRTARQACDCLITLLHGGNELNPLPRPGLQDLCHFLVEAGANAIICQHSHCAGTFEEHRGGLIVYGQGNFLFDYPKPDPVWNSGFLVALSARPRGGLRYEFIPYRRDPGRPGIRPLESREAQEFVGALRQRSEILREEKRLRDAWIAFCEANRGEYTMKALGFNRVMRALYRRGWLPESWQRHGTMRALGNLTRCESHREVIATLTEIDLRQERRAKASDGGSATPATA